MPMPPYLESLGVRPSWMVSDEKRASLTYRCRRLNGLVNIYYWAMQWTVHRACNWSLGEEAYGFVLRERELWLLGIETVADLARTGWKTIAESVWVRKSGSPGRTGSISLAKIKRDDTGSIMPVNARHFDGGVEQGFPQFAGTDLADAVCFRDDVDCLPWQWICIKLGQAYTNAERHLKAEQIRWNGPPLFNHHGSGRELLADIETRQLDPRVVLSDLEQRRWARCEEIETVERAEAQRANVPPPILPSDPCEPVAESKVVALYGLADRTPFPAEPVAEKPAATRIPPRKEPQARAFLAYRLHRFSGMKQDDIASQLGKSQKTISAWTKQVKEWCEAGNPLPDSEAVSRKIQALDPAVLELGAQIEGRTPRQRNKANR